MINMFKADFYRLIRSKAFYIAIAIMLLMIGLDIYTVQPGSIAVNISTEQVAESPLNDMSYDQLQSMKISDIREIMLDTEGYELDRDILSANMNMYYLFIFTAAILIASEFSGGIVKNTLSSAISRKRYFLSKTVFVNICCIGMLFLNTYVMYFSNIVFNSKNLASDLGTVTKITMMQLPPILALISILTGLAFILKKTALFNTIAIPLMIVLQLLLNMAKILFKIKESVMGYEFQTMLTRLAGDPSDSYILHCYLLCVVVIVVFNLLGFLSFKKSEIR